MLYSNDDYDLWHVVRAFPDQIDFVSAWPDLKSATAAADRDGLRVIPPGDMLLWAASSPRMEELQTDKQNYQPETDFDGLPLLDENGTALTWGDAFPIDADELEFLEFNQAIETAQTRSRVLDCQFHVLKFADGLEICSNTVKNILWPAVNPIFSTGLNQ